MTTQFDRFHNDLNAAIAAGAPIQLSESSRRITQKELDLTQEKMADHLAKTQSSSLKEAIGSVTNVLPRYRAALQTFAQTQTMLPVLEGLTMQQLAEKKVAKALRHAFYYLFVLVSVTVFGLLLYSYKVVPILLEVRKDTERTLNDSSSMTANLLPWIPIFTTVLAVGLGLMLVWFLLGGIKKLGMWCGGKEYVRRQVSHVAIRATQLLIESGAETEEAVELGCTLANCDKEARGNVANAFNSASKIENAGSVQRFADYLVSSANERLNYIRSVVPVTVVIFFGGLVTTAYCLILFWPFVCVIWDVSSSTGVTR